MAKKSKRRNKKLWTLPKGFRDWAKAFLMALGLLLLIRFFVYDLHSVSHSSMEQTLLPGDVLLVNKFNYGARMPLRLVPQSWVNLFFSTDSLPPVRHLPYWRFASNRPWQPGDMVLLNTPAPHHRPIDRRSKSISRLVALPGDEVLLQNGQLRVNGQVMPNPTGLQWNYLVELNRDASLEEFLDSYHIREGAKIKRDHRFVFPFTAAMADSLGRTARLRSIRRQLSEDAGEFVPVYGEQSRQWTSCQFGPLLMPRKGQTIALSPAHLDIYGYILRYHERKHVQVNNDSVYINGQWAQSYTFRHNYYFFLGDNRHNTSDSRFWGPVPENHIIGRVASVLFSYDKNAGLFRKFRWNRFFTSTLDDPS